MKAAVLRAFGLPLSVEEVQDPVLGTGEVIVQIVASPVLHYAGEVFSGERKYLLNLPIVPGTGGIGKVLATGPDVTRLTVGDWVLCDPTVRSRDSAINPDITLQGLSARGPGGLSLQNYYHNGSFAAKMMLPTENAISLGQIKAEDAARWCAANVLLVPYGGLLAVDLQAGETIVISGATGYYGGSAVAVALAMGAGCVVAPGRNKKALNELSLRFGSRICTVELTGDEQTDKANMMKAAPGPVDCVFDMLAPSADPKAVRAAIMTVREYGRVVLMGGVGMMGVGGLDLSYAWIMRNSITIKGQWMYLPDAPHKLISLVKSGLLSLAHYEISEFPLDEANQAVAYAAKEKGASKLTVIKP